MLIAFQKDWTLSGYSEKKKWYCKFLILSNFTLLKVNLSIIVMIIIILYYRRTKTTTEGRTTILNSLKKLFLLHVAAKLAPLAELKTPQLFLKYLSHSFSSSLDSYVLLTAYNEKVRAHACHGGTSCALTCQSCVLSLTFHQRASWFWCSVRCS